MACGLAFRTTAEFDRHRVAINEAQAYPRRCFTPDELSSRGWLLEGDLWVSPIVQSTRNSLMSRKRSAVYISSMSVDARNSIPGVYTAVRQSLAPFSAG